MIKNLNKQFESFFDESENKLSIRELKKNFQLVEDNNQLENLSYIFSSPLSSKELPILFARLSSFFELGFLIEKTHLNHSRVVQMFIYSHSIQHLHGLKSLTLPKPELFKVLSTNSVSFLNNLNLKSFEVGDKMNSFLIRISENQSLVVMSELAEPWLQLRIESLQKTLMKIPFEII